MDEKQFNKVSEKLDRIMKILAIQALQGKTGKESIKALSAVGFQPKEIAELIGTTSNTVSVVLSSTKKGNKHAKRKNG